VPATAIRAVTEAALPGHLRGDEEGDEYQPGSPLPGDAPITAALAELKKLAGVAPAPAPRRDWAGGPRSARLGGQREWRHHLLAGGGVADGRLAFPLDFLDPDDALHRQVQHLRVAELVAQALLGRVHHHAFVQVEDQLAHLGEAPQRAAADVA